MTLHNQNLNTTQTSQRLLAVGLCGFLILTLLYAGCSKKEDPAPPAATDSGKEVKTETEKLPPVKPLLKGWEKPVVTLILSGEQHGYLEPCGCSETQSGGLARREDLIRQLKAKDWPVLGLDLGGTLNSKRATRTQSRLKFETILNSLQNLNYGAVGIGPEELLLENTEQYFLLTKQSMERGLKDGKLSFVSANVVLGGDPNSGTPLHYELFEVNGKKIAVTSILGKSFWKDLFPEGAQQHVTYQDPETALPPVLKTMQDQKPDLLILLSHATREESSELAKQFPQFSMVVSCGFEEPQKPETIGKTLLVTTGHKGKNIGVVGYYPDAPEPFKVELVELDNRRFGNSHEQAPEMRKQMQFYQDQLGSLGIAQDPNMQIRFPGSTSATFVGAAKCGTCHTKAYAKWKESRHGHAYESLSIGRKGQEKNWISRVNDAECLACHVTGWDPQQALRYPSGFESHEKTPWLEAQQCENCHGPGSEHVATEELWNKDRKAVPQDELLKTRQAVKLKVTEAEQKVCIKCHDGENSPKFNFEEYWPKIKHPWRD